MLTTWVDHRCSHLPLLTSPSCTASDRSRDNRMMEPHGRRMRVDRIRIRILVQLWEAMGHGFVTPYTDTTGYVFLSACWKVHPRFVRVASTFWRLKGFNFKRCRHFAMASHCRLFLRSMT